VLGDQPLDYVARDVAFEEGVLAEILGVSLTALAMLVFVETTVDRLRKCGCRQGT